MKILQIAELETLVDLLLGEKCLQGVSLWRSQLRALSKAITFVENDPLLAPKLLSHAKLSKRVLKAHSRVIGLTGLPGSGKSTLTNLIVKKLRDLDKSVAVFAVDPSSPLSGGAILGDRIRMQEHFKDPQVFIRSMGSRGTLGGLSKATRSAIRLSSLLNFDYIIVETVGIGQSEIDIINIADSTLLVLMPNSGDEIQLMKAGILQLADIYIVNKCDLSDPSRMVQELEENSMRDNPLDWFPPVLKVSAKKNKGISDIINKILEHARFEDDKTIGKVKKIKRIKKEILNNILILTEIKYSKIVDDILDSQLKSLMEGETTAMAFANKIILEAHNIESKT